MTRRALPTLAALAALPFAAPAMAKPSPLAEALGAPDDLSISATVRARAEGIDGQFRPSPAAADSMVSLRTTLAIEYDAGPVRFGGELWDARAYGEGPASSITTSDVNTLELVQAYAKVELGDWKKGAKGGRGLLTLGRQTMDIGSRRLVARNRFRQTTNGFTGVNLEWTTHGGARLQAFWTLPQIRLPDDAQGLQDNTVKFDLETTRVQFFGAHATLPRVLGGTLETYGYRLAEQDGDNRLTRNRRLWTLGARAFARPQAGKWDHDVEGAYQFGTARRSTSAADMTDLDVSAWFLHAEAGYTLKATWKPRLAALFDAASGDGGRAGHYGRFDTLYGARRFDFGPTALYGALQRTNIIAPGLRLEAEPDRGTDVMLSYRALWLENPRDAFATTGVRDARGASGRFAGHQAEARLRHWLVPALLQAETGGAVLFKQGFLRDAPNAPASGNSVYGYFDLTLTL
ncbi:alginate export family protein [Novosphingobium sp.]|uniref:alginate export family protein n=1 Tax=Novosphingobium sp. TaxID=1874826 RepID=UPI0025EF1A08|nr:alginate export family protein [Novosphingobium sp.]